MRLGAGPAEGELHEEEAEGGGGRNEREEQALQQRPALPLPFSKRLWQAHAANGERNQA